MSSGVCHTLGGVDRDSQSNEVNDGNLDIEFLTLALSLSLVPDVI